MKSKVPCTPVPDTSQSLRKYGTSHFHPKYVLSASKIIMSKHSPGHRMTPKTTFPQLFLLLVLLGFDLIPIL